MVLLISLGAFNLGAIAKQPKRQLLSNGGFEQSFAGWKVRGLSLVDDSDVAHRGRRCAYGQVTKRKQGHHLKRTIKLSKEHMYRLSIWARADKGSRMTVWRIANGQRDIIANWSRIAKTWTRYQVSFTVSANGPINLEIVAPSSHWAPPGRMWIDDVALIQESLWPRVRLSSSEGFNDFPTMVQTGQDTAWVAWLSFRDGWDTLQAAQIIYKNGAMYFDETIQVVGKSRILHPTLVHGNEKTWLLYSQESGGNFDIFAQELAESLTAPIRISEHPEVDVHPTAVIQNQTLWVVWESNRFESRRQIYCRKLTGNELSPIAKLSDPESNNYNPAIAQLGANQVWVGWHSFRDGNVDLYGRIITDDSAKPEQRITQAAGIDRNLVVFSHRQQIWLAWEYANHTGYKVGRTSEKSVQIAKLAPNGLLAPARIPKNFSHAESPQLAQGPDGRLYVSILTPRDRNSGWDVILFTFSAQGWSKPRVLSRRKTLNRRADLAFLGDQVVVSYESNNLPNRWKNYQSSTNGSSDVFVVFGPIENTKTSMGTLANYRPPEKDFEPAKIRKQFAEDRRGWVVNHQGESYRLLFGDLHEHSDISVCDRTNDESPEQSYQMMRDLVRFDFGGLTDHGKSFNEYLWQHLGKVNRANTDPGRFVAFQAQEWTSNYDIKGKQHPYGYYGHRNLFFANPNPKRWYNAGEDTTPAQLWQQLRDAGQDFVSIPHQLADTGNVPIDWNFNDQEAEPVAEIFQYRGSYECRGCPRQAASALPKKGYYLRDAWERGIIIGVGSSPF